MNRLTVKQVLSGDCLILRDKPKFGPPPERTVALSNILCPKLARRPNAPGDTGNQGNKDEPFAWEARELVRKRCIGRIVSFSIENTAPSGREYGTVYLDSEGEPAVNVAELLVEAGLAEVRKQSGGNIAVAEGYQRLIAKEDEARAAKRGKWGPLSDDAIRQVQWNINSPVQFVEARFGKPQHVLLEHVRDGCTYRAVILPQLGQADPTYYYLTLQLSGVRTPVFKQTPGSNEQIPEPYAEEARFFVECRLLQREVTVLLQSTNNQNLVGTVLHPRGNIAELLLKEGFGRCIDWSMGVVSSEHVADYRQAEKIAKEKRLRIWKDYETVESSPLKSTKTLQTTNGLVVRNSYSGKVTEVGNGDSVTVKVNGVSHKLFISSIRSPKPGQIGLPVGPATINKGAKYRPLYDIPYMFEAREFLRKKLVGKKVSLHIDYIQPKSEELKMEERVMATVTTDGAQGVNVGEALVLKGLASVIRYRATDENRSIAYDALLSAEQVAEKKAVGLHSRKDPPTHKIADLSGDVAKSKQFFHFLKRGGKLDGIVEYVASGSRLRVYIPKETCIITLLCAGIDCVRPSRKSPSGIEEAGDEYGNEALEYTKSLCMQREVEVEIENMDKGGNFIGWLFVDDSNQSFGTTGRNSKQFGQGNLSVLLVEHGFAKVHFTADKSQFKQALDRAEDKAKAAKLNIWQKENLESQIKPGMGPQEGNISEDHKISKKVMVATVGDNLNFFCQFVENEKVIAEVTSNIIKYFADHMPVPGSYRARKGDICGALFSLDNTWYRARVTKVNNNGTANVLFIDYGNEEVCNCATGMATLPTDLAQHPPLAHQYRLACVNMPPELEDRNEATEVLKEYISEKIIDITVQHDWTPSDAQSGGNIRAASIHIPPATTDESPVDPAECMLRDGYLIVDTQRKEKRLRELLTVYNATQDESRTGRRRIWHYGDFRGDD